MPRTLERRSVERLIYSASNYWCVLVGDGLSAVAFLALGLWLFDGSIVAGSLVALAGLGAWGGVEYAAHRWVLHGPSSVAKRAHARHHANGTALISAPALMSTTIAAAAWALLSVPFSAGLAALAVFGLYAGYNYYALLHHVQHHHRAWLVRVPSLARLEQAHRTHHARHIVNYGVSTTLWDRLFGTYQPSDAPIGQRARHRRMTSPRSRQVTPDVRTGRRHETRIVVDDAQSWARYAGIEDARAGARELLRDDRVLRVMVVRNEIPTTYVEWMER